MKAEEVVCVSCRGGSFRGQEDDGEVRPVPPDGSPGESSCGMSERSCTSSGTEDPPLHPRHLSALQHPGVRVQKHTHDGVD